MPKIRHIAIFTENPEELAKFYVDVFGMEIRQPLTTGETGGRWIFLSDGYLDMALIARRGDKKDGIDHFGFTFDKQEYETAIEKLQQYQIQLETTPPERPYVEVFVRDPHGNRVDLSRTGLRLPE